MLGAVKASVLLVDQVQPPGTALLWWPLQEGVHECSCRESLADVSSCDYIMQNAPHSTVS